MNAEASVPHKVENIVNVKSVIYADVTLVQNYSILGFGSENNRDHFQF